MPVGDIFRATSRCTQHGQTLLNVAHYRMTATGTGEPAVALAGQLGLDYSSAFKANSSNELVWDDVTVQKIHPTPVEYPVTNATGSGPGINVEDALPTEVAAVVSSRTKFAGKSQRGRIYIGGLPMSSVTDSSLNGAGQTRTGNIATAFFSAKTVTGFSFEPIIWHRKTSSYDVILGITIRTTLRAQRRRQPGRGV